MEQQKGKREESKAARKMTRLPLSSIARVYKTACAGKIEHEGEAWVAS